jgi:hypothetical protein
MFKTAAAGLACRRSRMCKTAYNPEKVAASKRFGTTLSHTGTLSIRRWRNDRRGEIA